jgi:uncharacterized membrane protein YdjX (TVP38/TMEM64 family)
MLKKLKKQLKNEKLLQIGKVLLAIVLLSATLRWLVPSLTSPKVRTFVRSLGPFGPFFVIGYTIISHVLAPLAGTPGVLLSIALFGIPQTMVYIYFASVVSAGLCFGIARRFGRDWVMRLVGKEAMEEVDHFVEVSGTRILILSRIFGFSLFEIISYAAGLTTISFKKYFAVTAVFTLIPNTFFSIVFKDLDFSSWDSFLLWLGTLISTGLLFSYFVRKFVSKGRYSSIEG